MSKNAAYTGRIVMAGRLPFGRGTVGRRNPLLTPEEENDFASELEKYLRPITVSDTAECMEDRLITGFADGTKDPNVLAARVTHQLPGGLYLAATKAAVAADLAMIRDAGNFTAAYLTVGDFLFKRGYKDASHENCGASGSVQQSVAQQIPALELMIGLPALTVVNKQTEYYLGRNSNTMRHKLDGGFYGGWDPRWHESYVAERFPGNFASIKIDTSDPLTHGGHYGAALFIVRAPGYGFAKTAFAAESGKFAFGLTTPAITPGLVKLMAGSAEEAARLRLAFGVDPQQVACGIVTRGFPVFAEAA